MRGSARGSLHASLEVNVVAINEEKGEMGTLQNTDSLERLPGGSLWCQALLHHLGCGKNRGTDPCTIKGVVSPNRQHGNAQLAFQWWQEQFFKNAHLPFGRCFFTKKSVGHPETSREEKSRS